MLYVLIVTSIAIARQFKFNTISNRLEITNTTSECLSFTNRISKPLNYHDAIDITFVSTTIHPIKVKCKDLPLKNDNVAS
jgi:hypothetical protein